MDQTVTRERLAKAEDDIHREEQHIDEQRALIAKLAKEGHDSSLAEQARASCQHSIDAMKHHRNILLEQPGFYEPGESSTYPGVEQSEHKIIKM